MNFSQRKGLKPAKKAIQAHRMDEELRNRLWNLLCIHFWNRFKHILYVSQNSELNDLLQRIWQNFYKLPFDAIPDAWHGQMTGDAYKFVHNQFFSCGWNEVYDLIEFMSQFAGDDFTKDCNVILEQESSAYRFAGGKVIEITSEQEIQEIDEALETTASLKTVNSHLTQALSLLADRKSPDYRNSAKESISAVEAMCRLVTKNPKATLPEALKVIEANGTVQLHSALKKALDALYGYTSDAEGIRHALSDIPTLGYEDAKFMLVSCSAFVNFLAAKSASAEINLEGRS
ncbi:MAG: AbiJ-NTD4 domain-containing protein [Chloroflexota bacterium]